jgi:putative molybdopterin biosynthesis protein
MGENKSYTAEEVANLLKITKFTVYEMIKRGDLTGYRVGRKIRIDASDLEAYIRKSKDQSPAAAHSQNANPDENRYSARDELIICGQDMILDILARHLEKRLPAVRVLRNYCGSIDGLTALYHGTANVATAHLWDSDTDSYNVSYVRSMLPGHRALIINLAFRTEGFYVAKGNPKEIRDWPDLTKSGVRFINRERGCGARVLLDEKLRILDLDRSDIDGYEQEVTSHAAVASSVARGDADVGLGIEKVARQVQNIDFIPLQKERYDLVIRKEDAAKPHFQALLSVLQSASFRDEIAGMGGYDLSSFGKIVAET